MEIRKILGTIGKSVYRNTLSDLLSERFSLICRIHDKKEKFVDYLSDLERLSEIEQSIAELC